jgi:excinuclease ABC subunit B
MGFCSGVENYSRHLTGRKAGETPYTLLDYFPEDYLIVVDESHVTLPQFRGMFEGDKSRKLSLIDYGFRLPSAADNRPLRFGEFEDKINQMLFVSATPGPYEAAHSQGTYEQIIRPTGLVDPMVEVRPTKGQIDDLLYEINKTIGKKQKVLVTTLTKKMAERLTDYLAGNAVGVRYLHSDIHTLERLEIIRDLRLDVFDVIVGINLLREGLDIPEVSLVAILDADKEGFLRSETSLVQTIGRSARHVEGRVIMYADKMTGSMTRAIAETDRRRAIQQKYNEDNGITPMSIVKSVRDIIKMTEKDDEKKKGGLAKDAESMSRTELLNEIKRVDKLMKQAASELNFERAAILRDEMMELRKFLNQ